MSYIMRALTIFKGPRFSYFVSGNYNRITVVSKSADPAGPPSVHFEGLQAFLLAIGPNARLILTPGYTYFYIIYISGKTFTLNKNVTLEVKVKGNLFEERMSLSSNLHV